MREKSLGKDHFIFNNSTIPVVFTHLALFADGVTLPGLGRLSWLTLWGCASVCGLDLSCWSHPCRPHCHLHLWRQKLQQHIIKFEKKAGSDLLKPKLTGYDIKMCENSWNTIANYIKLFPQPLSHFSQSPPRPIGKFIKAHVTQA